MSVVSIRGHCRHLQYPVSLIPFVCGEIYLTVGTNNFLLYNLLRTALSLTYFLTIFLSERTKGEKPWRFDFRCCHALCVVDFVSLFFSSPLDTW